MPFPKISVIMPTFNGADCLRRSIEHVLAQTMGDLELIVIDDGSSDASHEIARSFGDVRVKCFKQSNLGQSSARNAALSRALGQYIAYCDQDDYFGQDHLELMSGYLDANLQVGMVYAKCLRLYLDGRKEYSGKPFNKRELEYFCYFVPSMVVHRKECLDKTGLWDEVLGRLSHEDMDFFLRFSDHYSIEYVDQLTVTRQVLRPGGGYAQAIKQLKYFSGLSRFMEKRLTHFKAAHPKNKNVAPFPGYYYHIYLSQCHPVILYCDAQKIMPPKELIETKIIPAFTPLLRIEKRSFELRLLLAMMYSLCGRAEQVVDLMTEVKLVDLSADEEVKGLMRTSLKVVAEALRQVGQEALAVRCLDVMKGC